MRLLYCLVFWQTHFLLACSFEASARACCVALSDGVPIKRTLERFIESCHISSASLQIRCPLRERGPAREEGGMECMQFRLGHIPTLKVLSTWNSEFILHTCMEVQYVLRIVWHHRKSLDAKAPDAKNNIDTMFAGLLIRGLSQTC